MKYDFDKILERRNTCSSKWDSAPDGGMLPDDIIPMWVADMDFPCAPAITDAIHAAADRIDKQLRKSRDKMIARGQERHRLADAEPPAGM